VRQGDAPFQSRAVGPLLGDEVEPLEVHPGVPVPGVAEHEHAEGLGTAPQRHDPVVELPDGQVDELLVLVVDEQRRLEVVLGVRDPQAELLAGDDREWLELSPDADRSFVNRVLNGILERTRDPGALVDALLQVPGVEDVFVDDEAVCGWVASRP
jgi:hypothetical protein